MAAEEGAGRLRANVSAWTFPSSIDEQLIRPWRTAALVAAAVAAVELLVLVVVGGALIAKPSSGTAARPRTKAKPRARATRAPLRPKVHHAAAPAARLARGKVSVLVLNGNGRQGAAATTAARVSRARLPHRAASPTRRAPTSRAASSCTAGASRARAAGWRATSGSHRRTARRPARLAAPRRPRGRRRRLLAPEARYRPHAGCFGSLPQLRDGRAARGEEAALRVERVRGIEARCRRRRDRRRDTGRRRAVPGLGILRLESCRLDVNVSAWAFERCRATVARAKSGSGESGFSLCARRADAAAPESRPLDLSVHGCDVAHRQLWSDHDPDRRRPATSTRPRRRWRRRGRSPAAPRSAAETAPSAPQRRESRDRVDERVEPNATGSARRPTAAARSSGSSRLTVDRKPRPRPTRARRRAGRRGAPCRRASAGARCAAR